MMTRKQIIKKLNLRNVAALFILKSLANLKITHGNGGQHNLLDYGYSKYGFIIRIFGSHRYSFIVVERTENSNDGLAEMALKKLLECQFFQQEIKKVENL